MLAYLKNLTKMMSGGGECCGGKKSCDKPEGKSEMKAGCCGGAQHAHGHDHHHHDDEDTTTPGKGGCCG